MKKTVKEEYKFTNECRKVFAHMKDNILPMYPGHKIVGEHYLLSVGESKTCEAYRILSGLMLSENLEELWRWCIERITSNLDAPTPTMTYDKTFDKCLLELSKNGDIISSGRFLCAILKDNVEIAKKLSVLGVTVKQIEHELEEVGTQSTQQTSDSSKEKDQAKQHKPTKIVMKKPEKITPESNELDKLLINVNKLSSEGKIDEVIGNDDIINSILTSLLKRDKNNALLVGDVGSGKTSTVMHIANRINDETIGKAFENKILYKIDFMTLVSGTGFRGGFEAKYEAIVEMSKKMGNCIVFIDDIHSILGQNSKFSEVSTDMMLDRLLSEKRIPCICTTTYEGYSKTILGNEVLNTRFEKIEMPKRSKKEICEIANRVKEKYEMFHNVVITRDFIEKTINICERFMPNYGLSTICEIMDLSASIERMDEKEDEKLLQLKNELQNIEKKINSANSSTDSSIYGDYDSLMKQKVAKKSEISLHEKELNIIKKKNVLVDKHLIKAVSQKTGISVGELSKDETEKLSNLSQSLKQHVIGQDEAVDAVCSSVRRQRSGLSDRNKPQVFLFVGKTGCGKTFLAKKLSEKVYGSEHNMVRLDMSEYADKISVNKLTGASSGYIGYDDGGVLTEAVKKNRHCVVLLDEIEKADNGVFDVFLQVFDEGRLTDNKGITVDFSDTIIIMTSNIGMKEIEDRGSLVGFNRNNENDYDKDIVMKTLKKRFKPEFINRINNIIYFNSLSDENIRTIIINELKKLEERVKNVGYEFSEKLYTGKTIENIFNNVTEEREYGARPVIRTIEKMVEEKIADMIIEGKVEKGYVFSDKDFIMS